MPKRTAEVVDATTGEMLAGSSETDSLIDDTVAYYQSAAAELRQLTR
jgi:hypothetical protein